MTTTKSERAIVLYTNFKMSSQLGGGRVQTNVANRRYTTTISVQKVTVQHKKQYDGDLKGINKHQTRHLKPTATLHMTISSTIIIDFLFVL